MPLFCRWEIHAPDRPWFTQNPGVPTSSPVGFVLCATPQFSALTARFKPLQESSPNCSVCGLEASFEWEAYFLQLGGGGVSSRVGGAEGLEPESEPAPASADWKGQLRPPPPCLPASLPGRQAGVRVGF